MVFAHAGGWLVSLLYAAPIVIIVFTIVVQKRRERGREDEPVASSETGEWTPKPSSEPHTSSNG